MLEDTVNLPPPTQKGDLSLEEVISKRRSHRAFSPRELTWKEIGQLAWAAQGITGSDPRWRSTPSAGALHPLVLYVLLPQGTYRYIPTAHKLQPHQAVNLAQVAAAALRQQFITKAPCVFAFAGELGRIMQAYRIQGRDFAFADLGHASQNLLLQATALNLVGVPVGAFNPSALSNALHLPPDQKPLYLIPVGRAP